MIDSDFERLVDDVQACRICPRMDNCTRVLSRANGNIAAPLMFVGEAPGRLGADRTAIPFHGDKSGNNFELLLSSAGLSRRDIFVTNAVLCNPQDADGNNAPPSRQEIANCVAHLKRQIDLIQPKLVMTLGSVALEATRMIEQHELVLRTSVRTANEWYGRRLLPLYHPGARAMIHRSLPNQTADYYFVAETLRRIDKPKRKIAARSMNNRSWAVLNSVMEHLREFSLFRLHKVMFLIDLAGMRELNEPLTDFFYIRQKDGPYCVDLGGNWYSRFENVRIQRGSIPRFSFETAGLFQAAPDRLDEASSKIVDRICNEVRELSDPQLKTKAYLTGPMRKLLAEERAGRSTLNFPLLAQ